MSPIDPTRRRILHAALCSPALALPGIARAATWPEHPITLIVPFGAGGGNDITSRTLARFLEKELGVAIVIVNKPGAGGEIGLNALVDAKPDGYTLCNFSTPGIVTVPIERKPRWSLDSFECIASVVNDPAVIAVHPDSGINTIAEFVAAAKKEPGKLAVATQGQGSASAFSVQLFESAAGIQLTSIPYTTAPQITMALAQKLVVAATSNIGEGMMMTSGQPWRTIGVMAAKRQAIAPEVPTFKEAGYDIEMGSLRGIGAPKGTPAAVIERLSAAIAKVVRNPEYLDACARSFQPIDYQDRATYTATLRKMDDTYRAMWQAKPWR